MMNERNEMTVRTGIVLQDDWEQQIVDAFNHQMVDEKNWKSHVPYRNKNFLDKIWEMSLHAFDIPREVQVVVDGKGRLFISHGSPGLVWFDKAPVGMSLPLRCWIHTHPFGAAYFSGTDWHTINTWRMMLPEAIVLGGKEKMTWFRDGEYTEFIRRDYYEVENGQTKLDDWREEE
jgi:hypothetical protein